MRNAHLVSLNAHVWKHDMSYRRGHLILHGGWLTIVGTLLLYLCFYLDWRVSYPTDLAFAHVLMSWHLDIEPLGGLI